MLWELVVTMGMMVVSLCILAFVLLRVMERAAEITGGVAERLMNPMPSETPEVNPAESMFSPPWPLEGTMDGWVPSTPFQGDEGPGWTNLDDPLV
jgi:hypothetical protein